MSRHCLVGTGPYSLQTQRTPEVEPSTHTGNFRFDTESGAICDESCPGSLLGRFAAVALDGDMEFDLTRPLLNDRPCVHVVSSEVMAEMQKPENAHAFFVLPSQFNGVEFPSHCSVVEAIEEYKYDNTGGPAAQLAAHPAIGQFLLANAATQGRPDGISSVRRVLRQANTALREKGVTSQKQMFDVINGYLKMPVPDCDETATLALDALRMALPSLRLLVTFDAKVQGLAAGRTQFSTADHSVNLVYASAVPINAYVNGIGAVQKNFGDEKMKEFQSAIARLLLLTQYFGSLRTDFVVGRCAQHRPWELLSQVGEFWPEPPTPRASVSSVHLTSFRMVPSMKVSGLDQHERGMGYNNGPMEPHTLGNGSRTRLRAWGSFTMLRAIGTRATFSMTCSTATALPCISMAPSTPGSLPVTSITGRESRYGQTEAASRAAISKA